MDNQAETQQDKAIAKGSICMVLISCATQCSLHIMAREVDIDILCPKENLDDRSGPMPGSPYQRCIVLMDWVNICLILANERLSNLRFT